MRGRLGFIGAAALVGCGELLGVSSDSSSNPPPTPTDGGDDAGRDAQADAPTADAPDEAAADAGPHVLCDGGALCAISTSEPGAYGIAVDADHVYWTLRPQTGAGAVRRWSKSTGLVETFHPSTQGASAIALSSTDVYWTVDGSPPSGAVHGKAKTAAVSAGVTPIGSQPNPRGIAADDSYVAWSAQSTNAGQGLIRSTPTASLGSPVYTDSSGMTYPMGVAMDAQYIYYGETMAGSSPAYRVPRGMTGASVDTTETVGAAYAFALAGTNVFIARGSGGVVFVDKATFTSGTVNSVDAFATPSTPCAIAASGTDVVWLAETTYVRRADATSPMMSNLAAVGDGSAFQCIAFDGKAVYWTWQDASGGGGVYAYPFAP